MTLREQTTALKAAARELGFVLVGACPAGPAEGFERLQTWLAAGRAGEMHYFAERLAAYRHPDGVMPGVRSLLMLGLPYRTDPGEETGAGEGRVSCYAWGREDYHDVVHDKLGALRHQAEHIIPGVRTRGVVDTAPLPEREFGQRAGLGWVGKNTLLINRHHGSWFFLAALLLDCELEYDPAYATDHCGTCTACLEACPTHAFPEPYVLDATRCISYLTIELRGPLPEPARSDIGSWVFGCDVCQDVCPWNRKAGPGDAHFAPLPEHNPLALAALFDMDDAAFRARFRGTALWRARRRGLLRNAAIVLGNQRNPACIPALQRGLQDHDPLVREAVAWALAQYNTANGHTTTPAPPQHEHDPRG